MFLTLLKRVIFYLPVKYFCKCATRTENISDDLEEFDPNLPIVYVLQSNSISDLLTLEKLTKRYNLPSPFSKLEVGDDVLPRFACMKKVNFLFNGKSKDFNYEHIFNTWIEFCKKNNCDLQIVPITIIWSRNPHHEDDQCDYFVNKPMSAVRKFFRLMFFGYDNMTICSGPIKLDKLIKFPNKKLNISTVLARACKLHFERRFKDVIGPKLPHRNMLINELLRSNNIQKVIDEVSSESSKTNSELESEVRIMLNEIVSDISYHFIRVMGAILHLVWNKLYKGISVHGADRVRELIHTGHEIVYIPCHRSHMDYLLTSYVFTKEGLIIPHVIAGNNLNFFPVNSFLRKCGAFFMRRKFKGDKLYTTVFREYLNTLFNRGYSVEFYIEGGRSRTGRTLPPRTGIVAMAVQAQLRNSEKPITFIPMYLGYEKVMEVNSYMNELNGQKKEKESVWQLFNIFKRFKYYGRGYVNFGEPITLPTFLRDHVENWRDCINIPSGEKPAWLYDTVNNLSDEIIMHLNAAAAINGFNLSALAILSSQKHKLSLNKISELINFYIMILKNSNFNVEVPDVPGSILLKQALELHPFHVKTIDNIQYAVPSSKQIIYLTYFRNNILHFFALPALIITIVMVHKQINYEDIVTHTRNVFYFLRHELYCPVKEDVLNNTIENYLKAFRLNEYIRLKDDLYSINDDLSENITILSECIQLNLIRYLVAANVIISCDDNTLTKESFIAKAVKASKELPAEITDNSPEFSEPSVFNIMYDTLIRHKYIIKNDKNEFLAKNEQKLSKLINAVGPLLLEKRENCANKVKI